MFDTLYCKYPLPYVDGITIDTEFQTKDFDNALDKYIITEEGKLLQITHRYEEVPEQERLYYGTQEWDKSPLFRIMGALKSIDNPPQEISLPKLNISFYTIIENRWVEYLAQFEQGKIIKITLKKNKEMTYGR